MRRVLILGTLIFAGEIIFSLPFHVSRFFRPTFLAVYELNNAQLGDMFAFYGVTAMLCYFPGGPLADYFSARKLMVTALLATAAGGLVLLLSPSLLSLRLLFAYWGCTTILLFWAAMIKAARQWGGEANQGMAYGLLDGGRGLVAAIVASLAIWLLTGVLDGVPTASVANSLEPSSQQQALLWVIAFYSAATLLAAALVWLVLPAVENTTPSVAQSWRALPILLQNRTIWLQGVVVICGYCGFKGLDNYGLYGVDALGMSELDSARFTAWAAYLRPVGAIGAGFLADRFRSGWVILLCFLGLVLSYGATALASPQWIAPAYILVNVLFSALLVFAIRGIYFALMQQSYLPMASTGSAAGLISVLGFTPDIFFAPLAGRILDADPGVAGQQNLFLLLAGFAAVGAVAIYYLNRINHR